MGKWLRREQGQSYLEAALVLPLLILLVLGVLDLGRAFNAQIVVTNAAREGARYGMDHSTDVNGIKNRAIQEAIGTGVTVNAADISVTYPSGTGVGNPIRVQVTHNFQPIVVAILNTTNIPVTAAMEMGIIK